MSQVLNPYAEGGANTGTALQSRSNMDVESSRVIAEVQASVMLAKKFPRSPQRSMDRILNECQRVSLAEKALYSYARGGTDITGPSIRLAEVIARNWENIDFGIKELSQANGQSEMMAYAWDLETNVRQVKVFTVRHIRHTKKGAYDLEDPRDIYEVAANNGARRLRACILGIIPGDVVEAAVSQSEETLIAKADTSPESIKKMVDAFAAFGVPKESIEKRIQRRMDAITPAQIISLRKIYTSIKDEMSAAADWFELDAQEAGQQQPGEKPKTGTEALKAALKGSNDGQQQPAAATPTSEAGYTSGSADSSENKEAQWQKDITVEAAFAWCKNTDLMGKYLDDKWAYVVVAAKALGIQYLGKVRKLVHGHVKDALLMKEDAPPQAEAQEEPEPPKTGQEVLDKLVADGEHPGNKVDGDKALAEAKAKQSFLQLQEFFNDKVILKSTDVTTAPAFIAAMQLADIGPGSRPANLEQARAFRDAYMAQPAIMEMKF
jgi:hypothetical protein